MNDEPVRNEQLLEAMESCRPDSDDLRDPNMADLARKIASSRDLRQHFERLQQADLAMKAAFQDVPVPEGLADRLLQRLAAARAAEAQTTEPEAPTPAPKRISRRGLLVAAGALSTAAAVLVAILLGFKTPQSNSPSSILEDAAQYFAADSSQDGHWLAETPAPEDGPFSRDVLQLPQIRWRSIDKFLGGAGVAYDLPPGPDGARATLYATRQTVTGLPAMPPATPAWDSGCSAGAWQDGDTLYVLVVEGDTRAYQSYLNLSRGPLT